MASPSSNKKRIFIVHGHDTSAVLSTARFIEKLDFEPVILQEQPSSGYTIIEKFELYADVVFAVVLLTPDDRGGLFAAPYESQLPRARQNVILELGFFIAKLGRQNVCVLYKSGIEIPSDYRGVGLIDIDTAGAWQMKLASEMKAAGIAVDLNKAF